MFLSLSFSLLSILPLLSRSLATEVTAPVDVAAYIRGHPANRVLPAYGAIITAPPVLDEKLLQKRGLATCGFVSGNPTLPLTCPDGFSCTSTVQDVEGWACCDQLQCVGNYRTCANYGAGLCDDGLDPDSCSSIYTSILSCSSADPYCFQYARYSSVGAYETDYSYACGQNSATVLVLDGTTDSGQAPLTETSEATALASAGLGSFPTQTAAESSALGSLPSNPGSTTSTPSNTSTGGLSTTDIIIIAVIAGIVVLAILGYLIYRCCISANNRHQDVHHPLNPYTGGSEFGLNVKYQPTNGAPTYGAPTYGAPTVIGGASVHGGPAASVVGRGPPPAGIMNWNSGVPTGAPPGSDIMSSYGDDTRSRY
ncbi:MAG: hypothetical protein MMC33_009497 [Icmadophila ericetorum]|nr:hypothetical protein [Icmadophila ericetorum]